MSVHDLLGCILNKDKTMQSDSKNKNENNLGKREPISRHEPNSDQKQHHGVQQSEESSDEPGDKKRNLLSLLGATTNDLHSENRVFSQQDGQDAQAGPSLRPILPANPMANRKGRLKAKSLRKTGSSRSGGKVGLQNARIDIERNGSRYSKSKSGVALSNPGNIQSKSCILYETDLPEGIEKVVYRFKDGTEKAFPLSNVEKVMFTGKTDPVQKKPA